MPSDGRASRSAAPRPPGAAARPRRARAAARLDDRRALRLAPDQRAAAGREHERPDDRVADPDAPRAEQQQRGEHQQHEPAGDHASSRAGRARAPAAARPASLASAGISAQQTRRAPMPAPPAAAATTKPTRRIERIDAEPPAEARADAAEHRAWSGRGGAARGCVSATVTTADVPTRLGGRAGAR